MPVPAPTAEEEHHSLPLHEVVLLLETDPQRGLTEAEAADRLARFGRNVLPAVAKVGVLRRLARQFNNPLVYVLLAASVVTLILRDLLDSAVILAVVVLNTIIGFIQESRAEAALEALRTLVRTEARVVRDGREREVPSEELVPGDLVMVEAGEKVPADLRLVQAAELRVDESALTGESQAVRKDELVVPADTPVADRRNTLYSGTLVTAGSAHAVVVATGAETELGRIHKLVSGAEALATPLTRKIARFSRLLTIAILAFAAVTFVIGVLRGQQAGETFLVAVALAVGAIPEGLPAAVTITLAIGVRRMAQRRAVIRRLPAVETLGSTTVICADKTGTLTENQMTVRVIWTAQGRYEVTGSGYTPRGEIRDETGQAVRPDGALRWSLLAGAGCTEAKLDERNGQPTIIGDPTEGAMVVVAAKANLGPDAVAASYPRVATIPFSSERRYMATLHNDRDAGGQVVFVKGAVERILDLCDSALDADGSPGPLDRTAVLRQADALASEGLRVLATAMRRLESGDEFTEERLPGTLTFTGLQAMLDPLRSAAPAAVAACRDAGIAVKMITGDHLSTATAIGQQLGLIPTSPPPHATVTGAELAALPDAELSAALQRASVLARVSPEQKLRIVESLQANDEIVAMTGDGVNDAPALRQANIGVAMGRAGTEVAKEAADMVLLDDDFATIEAAVEEGRTVFGNLTKFIVWILPTNVGESLVVLVAILWGATLPLLPTQILWINLTSEIALGLMLAFEPKEPGVMRQPPRDPRKPLLSRRLLVRVLLVSVLLLAGSWWLFESELAQGRGLEAARTAVVNLIVVVEAFYLFNCRSLTRSAWRLGLLGNRWLILGVLIQAVAQIALTYLPVMNQLFQTAPIGLDTWLRILAVSVLTVILVGVEKRLQRPAQHRPADSARSRAAAGG